MTQSEAAELVRLAGDLRDHADPESDPSPANARKVMRCVANRMEELAAEEPQAAD